MSFTSSLQGALAFFNKGFKVFPLVVNGKEPAFEKCFEWAATATHGTIEAYGQANPECNWGILPELNDTMVLDIDVKNKMNGEDSLTELCLANGCISLPATLTVRTPTSGRHLFFKGRCPMTRSKIGKGLDTRSIRSYVVCAGSTINGHTYKLEVDQELVELPDWLRAKLGEKAEAPTRKEIPGIQLDMEANVALAITHLLNAPVCEEGSGKYGGEYLYEIFCQVFDYGISKELARDLVLNHYNARCLPPWTTEADMKHFDDRLINAYKYRRNPIGIKSEEARYLQAVEDFLNVPLGAETEATLEKERKEIEKGLPTCRASSIIDADIPPREWIINGMALIGFLSVTAAPGGTGKSNLELLKAFAVVTGKNLLGPDHSIVKSGPVVYFNGEDPLDEMKRRVAALRVAFKLPPEALHNLHLVSGQDYPLFLASSVQGHAEINKKAVEKLTNTVIRYQALFLSCDPLVSMHRVIENSNEDMEQVAMAFKQIARQGKCAVSLVHHTNKAAMRDRGDESANAAHFRGASSLINAARVAHVLTRMTSSEETKLKIPDSLRSRYFKVELAKANLSAQAEKACWFKNEGIPIANGETIGACQYAPLGLIAELNKADARTEAKATKKGAIRVYIRAIIAVGEEMRRKDICTKAMQTKQSWAIKNETLLNNLITDAIFGEADFTTVVKGRTIFIRREMAKPDGAHLLL